MKHVIGTLRGVVEDDCRISANLTAMEVREGTRPKTAEAFGANQEMLGEVNQRQPGTIFQSSVRPGAGVALVVSVDAFLSGPDDKFLEKTRGRWMNIGHEALLGPVRDFDAPGDFFRQDVCAGIVEEENIVMSAFSEMVEMGFYRQDGWARLILPDELREYQARVDRELEMEWDRLAPHFPMRHEAYVSMRPGARDSLNGVSCILSTEPENGSVEMILLATVALEGCGWLVRDTEHRHDTGQPLNRTPMLACRRYRDGDLMMDPIQLALGPDGFDKRVFPTVLTEKYADNYANGKTMSVLRALGWLPW